MTLRLIETILKSAETEKIHAIVKEHNVLEFRQIQLSNDEIFIRILLDSEKSEVILDFLEKNQIGKEDNRVLILPVEATLPRAPEPVLSPQESDRINREELYEDIKNAARCSRSYLTMLVLSTIVVAAGLHSNNVTIIIGAMVIAPMLGPSVALGLGTTLGDLSLLRHALLTGLIGIAITLAVSLFIGLLMHINPTVGEVALRTKVGIGDATVALASGCAGALAFTTGISATLIGVMVAVALLPPLATAGLLLGDGYFSLAAGAFSLFLLNFICVNLACVTTFLVQGIHPRSWWEKNKAVKATYITIGLWIIMLLVLAMLILLLQQ